MTPEELQKVILSEVQYLESRYTSYDFYDIALALECLKVQLVNCYVTTHPQHAMHLVRAMAGRIDFYFNHNYGGIARSSHRPYTIPEFIFWVIGCTNKMTEYLRPGSPGDAKEMMCNLGAILAAMIQPHGALPREAY